VTDVCVEAFEYKPYGRFRLNTEFGIQVAGKCMACDVGYEDEQCTCGEPTLVVRRYGAALPSEQQ
jgi:hypothetical protein